NPELKIVKSIDNAFIPAYECKGDSGMSLRTPMTFDIPRRTQKLIQLGIKMVIPEGYEVQIRSRSGKTLKQCLVVAQSSSTGIDMGTIDNGYTGEVGVILYNRGPSELRIKRGEAIAQAVLCPVATANIIEVDDTDIVETSRGDGAYGSTGK
ncbi:MAG: dUTP diphosphatase, partial [Candidatus Aenigmarchaeota archaeon]|nr:dUTP diphosphatase [Candidatus Aenigmarchaeota archaeon]